MEGLRARLGTLPQLECSWRLEATLPGLLVRDGVMGARARFALIQSIKMQTPCR